MSGRQQTFTQTELDGVHGILLAQIIAMNDDIFDTLQFFDMVRGGLPWTGAEDDVVEFLVVVV